MDIAFNSFDHFGGGFGFAPQPADLGQTGNAWFDVSTHGIIDQRVREMFVMFE
jgi:hypothetical protein